MKQTVIRPKQKIVLDNTNPETQNIIIFMFRNMGLSVYEGTTEYDSEYPYLLWKDNELVQSRVGYDSDRIVTNTMEEFMAYFVPGARTHVVKISGKYDAVITKESVKVGCQTLSYDLVKEIYEKMESFQ